MKVSIFETNTYTELEDVINQWIRLTLRLKIIDIKYSIVISVGGYLVHSALILWDVLD